MGAIAGAAILPASALSAQSDPIFAAIGAWREARRRHEETYEIEGNLSGPAGATCDAYHEAAEHMCGVRPTTVAGAAALAEILADDISRGMNDWQTIGVASVAMALRAMVGGQPFADVPQALADLAHDYRTMGEVDEYFTAQEAV
jgi:hypothetical protein